MKEETRCKMVEETKNILKDIDEKNKVTKRIMELEKDPNVVEYIKLNRLPKTIYHLDKRNKKDIIKSIYNRFIPEIDVIDTNNIYCYLGAYRCNDFGEEIITTKEKADYFIFQNIENNYYITIEPQDLESFMNEHYILNPNNNFDNKQLYAIQDEFFTETVINGQENAVKKLNKQYHFKN